MPVTVETFMQELLTGPNGYYRQAGALGKTGDFITAPEISQLFGEMIGFWLTDLWHQLKQPRHLSIIELGPGRGTLLADALRVMPADLKVGCQLSLVEINTVLQATQQKTLQDYQPTWVTSLEAAIAAHKSGPIFIVANEFFDALPIQQYEYRGKQWFARLVERYRQHWHFFLAENSTVLPGHPSAKEGSILEQCPAGEAIIKQIAQTIAVHSGAALIIDYGYTQHQYGNSLQAVKNHQYVPLQEVDQTADLSAHVNFAALKDAARATADIGIYGPTWQRHFLRHLGIEWRLATLLPKASPAQRDSLLSGVRRLLHPEAMGAIFKVMAVYNKGLHPAGFDVTST